MSLRRVVVAAATAAVIGLIWADETVVMCPGSHTAATGCPDTATCCPHKFSDTGVGCCPFPNAVCCAGSYGLCCPSGTVCNSTGAYSGLCLKPNGTSANQVDPPPNLQTGGAAQVCTPGPLESPSSTLPSALIIGDSVSIGYTPLVQQMLEGKVQVQHSPSAGGGGADDTPYGKQCIVSPLESFIRTAKYEEAQYDVITFNFGLHDMEYNTSDGSHSLANYTAQLTAIADRLVATKSKIIYVLTTPFMPYKTKGDPIVQQLNAIGRSVAAARGIPVVDLYSVVTDKCGAVYTDCPICALSPCTYHYNAKGYSLLAANLSKAIMNATQS